jgi:Tfp pilus assembly protein PilF
METAFDEIINFDEILKKREMIKKNLLPFSRVLQSGKIIAVVFLILTVSIRPLTAQNTLVTQTLNKAKALRNEKKFAEAADVLGRFEKTYPGNLWVEQLYAQTLFWMKQYRQAETVYQRAIGFHPHNAQLRYDYAVLLYAQNRLAEAESQLQAFLKIKPDDAAAEALLGKILYYRLQFHQAEKHLSRAATLNPADKKTEALYSEVYRIVSPQLLLRADYLNDDQPMQAFGTQLKFRWFVSNVLDFDVSGNGFRYSDIPAAGIISTAGLGNRFHFPKVQMTLRLSGNWFYAGNTKTHDWGGTVQLEKKFGQMFRLNLDATRTNYTYTIASVNNNLLMMNQYSLDFSFGKDDSWNGKAGARIQFFPDDNYVDAFYAWFLSQPLHFSNFRLAFGYAFNYMDSKEDRFVEKKNGNVNSGNIEGVYVPYYTPHNQYANSVLLNFSWLFSQHAALYGHASVGVFSRTYAPGFSLSNGVPQKTFAYQNYTPLDLGLNFQTDISRKVALSLSYTFLQTYYYNSHNVRFTFAYYF